MRTLRKKEFWIACLLLLCLAMGGQMAATEKTQTIYNGIPWFDEQGHIINAHGACIVEDGGRYWLFGEYKSDESNAFPGFGCYSSADLVNWRFERVVLPVQKTGILGPNRVGERVKVMRCPATGEYIMLMHTDDLGYNDPYIGIATCKTINGDYKLQGPLLFNGQPVKRWDMGTFQDTDGCGYLLIHHGPIYRLSKDYRSIEAQVANIEGMGESPAMFKKKGIYYLLTSNLTSWERNDNYYFTAPSIEGPWTRQGLFCPEGTLTYNSQSTFVFPLKHGNDTIPIYMGDRWSYPHQASAATYVWLPLQTDGTRLSIPTYLPAWDVKSGKPVQPNGTKWIKGWASDRKGDRITQTFDGGRIAFVGESRQDGGYATVSIKDKEGKLLHQSYVDFYSKVPDLAIRFISKEYPKGTYTIEIAVTGEQPVWYDKKKTRFGSTGYYVRVEKLIKLSDTTKGFILHAHEPVTIAMAKQEKPVVHTALSLLNRDLQHVLGDSLQINPDEAKIIIGTVGDPLLDPYNIYVKDLKGKTQAFLLQVLPDNRLLIAGSDSHGTAYGLIELSRLLGVSPWEWWADVTPDKRETFSLPEGYRNSQAPDVPYRGIFINDEDWGLMPWSSLHYEPWWRAGRIGPRTNERIFELLLRLRANTYWPAMHECSEPFFLTPGNREVAERFGIYIGGSHCEPMASSTAGEWPRRGKGEYDYVHNSEEVHRFWENRVKEVKDQEILYTIGMRGVHDGQMQGAKSIDEQKAVLERVFRDQRALLQKYVNPDVTKVPQVFIPYKEVLDVYRAGLPVPEDVTLMWCDDNYGYITHYPTAKEQGRKGGNGIYYHASYWGRPHDYLWLGTFSPALLYQQMSLAYDRDIRKIWILNVGDIKPLEYQMELFMDMAWDIHTVRKEGWTAHMEHFLQRELGNELGKQLTPLMREHYRLAYIRKPEFLGNSREEEADVSLRKIKDLPWSRETIRERLSAYTNLSDAIERLSPEVRDTRRDAFFQLVKYPVQAATEMNKKLLYAQLARHGEADWSRSDAAYDSIVALTRQYNTGIANGGKWHRIMDHQPRRLEVFEPVDHTYATDSMVVNRPILYCWNGSDCTSGDYQACEGLGYEGKAVAVEKGKTLTFEFTDCPSDSVEIEIRLLPNHPIDGKHLRFALSLDGSESKPINYETQGRSEEWKENVLRNQAVRRLTTTVKKKKKHRLTFKSLDENIILDQLLIFPIK